MRPVTPVRRGSGGSHLLPCWATRCPFSGFRPADAGPLFYARLQWAPGPGRLDDIYQYTVEPRSGFALIDTWLSGDTAAFKNAIGHLAPPVLVLAYYSRWPASPA
ncbi:hypothetical protein LN650_23845 [Klebsiella pneumoniae subsp. pneumoniae]|nr:hypothetical protein [Klebsiella pneumoniae subsp. pneumoniae]